MGIIAYGPLASEVRGSVGGTTFTRGPFGTVVKNRTAPLNIATARREPFRSRLSMCASRWTNVLTQNQRDDWDTLAANTTFTNALGQEYHPTGLNLYIRTNALFYWKYLAWIDAAPASATGETVELEYDFIAGPQVRARLANGVTDAHDVVFWISGGYPISRTFHSGPYFYDYLATSDHLAAWEPLFIFPLVQDVATYFIRRRSIMPDGAIGTPVLEAALRIEL